MRYHLKIKTVQLLSWILLLVSTVSLGQGQYKIHSHNDYLQDLPFWEAYAHRAGSIEADVFLKNNSLYVAHTEKEIDSARTLEKLYLKPLAGLASDGKLRELQLLIDIKSKAEPTLAKLLEILQNYPHLRSNCNLQIVISGDLPAPEAYKNYPNFIHFDHQNLNNLDEINLGKVAVISQNFRNYSQWNGLGRLTAKDMEKVESVINLAHQKGKKIRFWAAPDTKTAWGRFAKMGVDFINTDHPGEAFQYLESLDQRTYLLQEPIPVYRPNYRHDSKAKPKNVILMIGDGNGLGQISSAVIANKGQLTITQLKDIGLIKTSAYDDLVTDSAAGGTAMATGKKTNNRAVGTGPEGEQLSNITEILANHGFINGVMTTDNITGATPSSFYAHQSERDNSTGILKDLLQSSLNFFVSAGAKDYSSIRKKFEKKDISSLRHFNNKLAIYLSEVQISDPSSRGNLFPKHVKEVLKKLGEQEKPYFLMIEGAKIDSNGHSNNIGGIVQEMLDFDEAIAEVLKAADKDQNTLVVITADHETSGFGIVKGSNENDEIEGDFLTNDHTATMVPVFSYGPQSERFTGVYENTEIFRKISRSLGIEN
ncbi:alkaline phosphatase [Antarcticibacterium sp. 1MA-6-2]|uniref:alkaline phosphatase n=1 Tax=Antarcticibacterium sp. 1MA-6-2 TaxID=2908210 RepID=UPI001F336AA3|nr:alkaline phosphatase [Antarcticibacterium sp. 1MA-6-2]UJH90078.1 alkaline phosphatase [Antarcticibacterium sp. 1MA-6-2]